MTLFLVLAVAFFLLVLPLYVVYKPPNILIRYFQNHWPDVLWHVPTTKKIIALTIDDAPSKYTEKIMQTLAEYNATATFFVIGAQVNGREDLLENIVKAGSELGNHAMHDEPSRSLSDKELSTQIDQVNAMIAAVYRSADTEQPKEKYFRPGSGFFSSRMRNIVQKLGYSLVLGGVYPHDPQISYAWINARHILSMVRPGSIIICHDRRPWTQPMLQKVLPELNRRGYRVVSISELLATGRGG